MTRLWGRALSNSPNVLLLLSTTAIAESPARSGRLRVPTAELYFERHGPDRGVPLILLNGGPGFDHMYFRVFEFWQEIAAVRPLVFYDQRGTGRSSPFRRGDQCKLVDQLTDLEALVKALDVPRVDLLGHSYGGYLGMAFAARYPSLVRRLVLVDSAAPKIQDTLFMFDQFYPEVTAAQHQRAYAERLGDPADPKVGLLEYFSMLFYSSAAREKFVAASGSFSYSQEMNEALMADLKKFDLGPELEKLTLPTLIVTGRFDVNVAPLTAFRIHEAIRTSHFVVFEHSGHLPFLEEPSEFVREVEAFLQAQ